MAQDNSLRIMSSKFNEKQCIALSFDTWIGDSNENCVVKGMLHVLAFLFPISIFSWFKLHSCCMVYGVFSYGLSRTVFRCLDIRYLQNDPIESSCFLLSSIYI